MSGNIRETNQLEPNKTFHVTTLKSAPHVNLIRYLSMRAELLSRKWMINNTVYPNSISHWLTIAIKDRRNVDVNTYHHYRKSKAPLPEQVVICSWSRGLALTAKLFSSRLIFFRLAWIIAATVCKVCAALMQQAQLTEWPKQITRPISSPLKGPDFVSLSRCWRR